MNEKDTENSMDTRARRIIRTIICNAAITAIVITAVCMAANCLFRA